MKKGYTLVELIIVIAMLLVVPALIWGVTMWTDRSLDFVLTALKGHPVHCPMWLAAIVSIVGNAFTLLFNVVVEIFRLTK